ncbi:hypothetical protein GCM10023331_19230 [Algivirga pacifica]|uniref:VanZ-like domain-containing protein n=2 Tax=Algivirga pacifica TaxID=1162670 RepID=A0ABP9DF31_9BACT
MDKVVHLGIFGALTFFYTFGIFQQHWSHKSRRNTMLLMVFACVVYGAITELIQHFIPYRSGDVYDFVVDTIGAVGGYVLGRLVIHFIVVPRLERNKKKSST